MTVHTLQLKPEVEKEKKKGKTRKIGTLDRCAREERKLAVRSAVQSISSVVFVGRSIEDLSGRRIGEGVVLDPEETRKEEERRRETSASSSRSKRALKSQARLLAYRPTIGPKLG